MTYLVVTGTGTEVGKTVVTAAVAALAVSAVRRVAVVKPAQTGVADGAETDVEVIRRLAQVDDVHELVRYPDPLAPATAARVGGVRALPLATMVERLYRLRDRELVLVEGAGGLLVQLDDDGHTIADVAVALRAPVLVVAAAGLGTLNSVALTCEALRSRELQCPGVVIGSWPTRPDVAARHNMHDLERYAGVPLVGALPEGAGRLEPTAFLDTARRSLAPPFGGCWAAPVADRRHGGVAATTPSSVAGGSSPAGR